MKVHTFSLFANHNLKQGSFFRLGGVSQGPYDSLNFSLSSGDDPRAVEENHSRAHKYLEISTVCSLKQCHGDLVVVADPKIIPNADAHMTNQRGIALQVLHADCQAALLYDPIHHAIAAIHCGWRGNVLNIYQKTIKKMHQEYQTKAEDLLVGISASLGPLAAEFRNFEKELPTSFLPFQVKPTYFNLWEISKWQLTSCGVKEENIELAGICTYANTDLCFSYRRLQKSGRHATFIALI